jgi:hypothetical protein
MPVSGWKIMNVGTMSLRAIVLKTKLLIDLEQ